MFRGHFEHAIDDKGRTSLPAKYRDAIGVPGRLILTRSLFDPCLDAFPLPAWEELEAKIARLPQFDPHVVRLRRRYLSAAVECDLDKQGRILVPPPLRTYAALGHEVLWAGMGATAELWARDRWEHAAQMNDDETAAFRAAVSEQLKL